MARYSTGINTTATSTGTGRVQIRAGSSDRVLIREIMLTIGAATASTFGLYRSATLGTASTSVVAVPQDGADGAAGAVIETAWSAAPTISTNVPLRRLTVPATIGAGFIWQFYDQPLIIPLSGGVILWALSATAAVQDIYVVHDE